MKEATVPIELIEAHGVVNCNVEFHVSRSGEITVSRVSKPTSPRNYVDIEVDEKTRDWIESWLYDNWSDY